MDASSWVAIAGILGTLIASAVSIVGTYIVQSKVSEREKRWAREADERKRRQELEDERRRIKRELLSGRLNTIEEAATINMFLLGLALTEEIGDPIYGDRTVLAEKRKRLEEIENQAWACVIACDSQRLKESYQAIVHAQYQAEQQGTVESEQWKKASESFVELVKIIDDMKTGT